MRILALLFLSLPLFAAVGDNAPPIPVNYNQQHPRLPHPSSADLTVIYNGGAMLSKYVTAANGWNSCVGTSDCSVGATAITNFRRLLVAYMAAKEGQGGSCADVGLVLCATWKAKITATLDLGGSIWNQLWGSDDNATADSACATSTTTCQINSTVINFLTACQGSGSGPSGGNCSLGTNTHYITWMGLRYTIQAVNSSSQAVIQRLGNFLPYPFPTGTGLKIRLFETFNSTMGFPATGQSLGCDWINNDLTAQQKLDCQTTLANISTQMENDWVNSNLTPYNDQSYSGGSSSWTGGPQYMWVALANYPDAGAVGLQHLRWAMDCFLNFELVAWKQVAEDGYWHESWSDYINASQGIGGLKAFWVSVPLAWATATNNMPGFFLTDNPWLMNFGYHSMYVARPDFTEEKIGDTNYPNLTSEMSNICTGGHTQIGYLNGLAEIYNNPVIRGWARFMNRECSGGPTTANGFYESSAWPWYNPDKTDAQHVAQTRAAGALPLARNFRGAGMIFLRTGWGETDTAFTLNYGDSFWSHRHFDTGAFTLFNRGSLAIESGAYHAGTASRHWFKYLKQTIAHNSLTITNPAESWPTQMFSLITSAPATICEPMPNDGGQTQVGSNFQTWYTLSTCGSSRVDHVILQAPLDRSGWFAQREFNHRANLLAYVPAPNETAPKYVYVAVDITPAYFIDATITQPTSGSTFVPPNVNTRTQRVSKVVRNFDWIPHGTQAYVLIYDQVNSLSPTYIKRQLIHTINQPTVTGNSFTVLRTENVAAKPFPGLWPNNFMLSSLTNVNSGCSQSNGCYQDAGRMIGYAVQLPDYAGAPSITTIGGPGHEFDDGNGVNQNECRDVTIETCADATDSQGLGNTATCTDVNHPNIMCPTSAAGPIEPGAWRIEIQPNASGTNKQDRFVTLLLAQNTSDTLVVTTPPTSTLIGSGQTAAYVITWKDGTVGSPDTCTYTLTHPLNGIGGAITIQGAGCVNVVN